MTPRLLIISADPISQTYNNGKTLESMISSWSGEHVAQIFTNPYNPCSRVCKRFFRITDPEVSRYWLGQHDCGASAENVEVSETFYTTSWIRTLLKGMHSFRLLREILWHVKWSKNESLNQWLDAFKPEVVLLMGGDGVFLYRICKYVAGRFDIPIVFQVTDEYLERPIGLSPSGAIHKYLLVRTFKDMMKRCQELITIGEQMRNYYAERFGVVGHIIMNCVQVPKDFPEWGRTPDIEGNEVCVFLYAGSLYYGRDSMLASLADALRQVNSEGMKSSLDIYTSSRISLIARQRLAMNPCVRLMGYVSAIDLKESFKRSDVLVIVESFLGKYIRRIRYSVSTKIPEYMISGRCMLAYGPEEVNSISYLKDLAFACTDESLSALIDCVRNLIRNREERILKAQRSFQHASKMHDATDVSRGFLEIVEICYQKYQERRIHEAIEI